MSNFSGTFPQKFFRSCDQGLSNKPEPLHNDFWDTLYHRLEFTSQSSLIVST